MGSTGEADRKRRHFSSISPTAATVKKQSLVPLSEEKKLDAAVLQFQNQKLVQKLETQKVEINALRGSLSQLKDIQQPYEKTFDLVDNSLEELVDDLESRSNRTRELVKHWRGSESNLVGDDGDSPPEGALLSRLLETGATESSSGSTTTDPMEENKIDVETTTKINNMVRNIVSSLDDVNDFKHRLYTASFKTLSSSGRSQNVVSSDLQTEVKNLRSEVLKLHVKHRSVAGELQSHRDADAKNKADLKRLKGELESTIAELEESNSNLAILKVERDIAKRTLSPVLNRANKQVSGDKARDKQIDLQDMESTLKEITDQSASRLHELKRLHEDRLEILKNLSKLQSTLKNVKCICSSQAYLLLKDQLAKANADVARYQALYEKLQVAKESLFWREKECHIKNEFVDVRHRSSAVTESRIRDLEIEIKRCMKERDLVETKLKEASKEPGRKEIISEFKTLVSSFPEKMGSMQNQLAKHKEASADIHALRANVQSLTNILNRKVKEFEDLISTSAQQNAETQKLQALVQDLKRAEKDLKLFLEMYEHESIDSREVSEARSAEIKAWARVHSLKFSLDESKLESRVKVAIEAEAKAQQKMAASEAEIANQRQKLAATKREKATLSDVLKSKHEETDAYLSEIETIGQAYDDMQTQNQQLLQQITERDDYNVKLVLEGVRAKQTEDALRMEKHTLDKAVHQTKKTVDFYNFKAGRIQDQLKSYTDHFKRLAEERAHNTATREHTQKRLLDVKKSSQQQMNTVEETQSKVDKNRACLSALQIELEKERFERKRVEEEIDTQRRKAQQLKLQAESCSVSKNLKQELGEYKEILKCSVCHDKRKEVVITKCYHLFCQPCVQRIIESRHRKCPVCAASFGPNDVKPIYI